MLRSALLRSTLLGSTLLAPLLFGAVPAALLAPAVAEQAGIAGAVNLDVAGTPPGSSERPVGIGAQIVRDEQIVTTSSGLAQILFLDQTTLTVGPNSDIVIDEFVYDPASAEGRLLMEATVGIFRVIGGGAATSGGVDVTTPFASIGIRGSNVVIEIAPDGTTRVTCNYCEEVVVQSRINPGQSYTISGSDRFRTVEIGPKRISDPFELPLADIIAAQTALTSRPGQSGGVTTVPSPTDTETKTVTIDNSDLPAGGLKPGVPLPVEVANNIPDEIASPEADDATTAASQENLRDEEVAQYDDSGGGGGGGGGGDQPVQISSTGRWISSEENPTQGWIGDKDDPGYTQTFDGATVDQGQITIPLSSGGTITVPYTPGQTVTFDGTGTTSPNGPVSGTGFVTAGGSFFYYDLVETNYADKRAILFGGTPVDQATQYRPIMAFDIARDPILNSPVPFTRTEMLGSMTADTITTSPLYFVSDGSVAGSAAGRYGTASLGIQGEGAEQQTVFAVSILSASAGTDPVLQGQTRAFSSVPGIGTLVGEFAQPTVAGGQLDIIADGSGHTVFGGQEGAYFLLSASGWTGSTDDPTLTENNIYRDSYTPYTPIQQVSARPDLPSGIGDDRPYLDHSGYAAGIAVNNDYGLSYYTVAGTMELSMNPATGDGQASMSLGTPWYGGNFYEWNLHFGNAVYVDRQNIMMQELGPSTMEDWETTWESVAQQGALASWQLVQLPGDKLPGGVTPCECSFMEWGFWAYDSTIDSGGSEPYTRRDTVTVGSWVVGTKLESESNLPFSGTATYDGHALAHIVAVNGETLTSYTAAGAMSTTVDFYSRSMQGTITQLDGRDYAFGTGDDPVGADFSMHGFSTDSQVQIDLNGSFFSGPTSPTQGIGGNLTMQSVDSEFPAYQGQGTFAAQCTSGC